MPPKRGISGAVAGNLSLPNTTIGEIIRDSIDQTQTGVPRPPTDQAQSTGTVENTSPSATLMSAFYFIATWTTMGINISLLNFVP
jgi:hypothetical protein